MTHTSSHTQQPDAPIILNITGMTCASCVRRVQKALAAVEGVTQAEVNLATERAEVMGPPSAREPLIAAVRKIGYNASPAPAPGTHTGHDHMHDAHAGRLGRDWILAVVLTVPLMIMAMGGDASMGMGQATGGGFFSVLTPAQWNWVQAVLATLVIALPGRHIFATGIKALWHLAPEMNALVAVGAGAAWLYSMVVTVFPTWIPDDSRHVYFEASAFIVTLILTGRWLEARAKGRASEAIAKLTALRVRQARVQRADQWVDVPAESLKPDDRVLVRPGEQLPADGVIEDGQSYIDESLITGESQAIRRQTGEHVIGGSVNGQGSLVIRVTHTGADSALAQIIDLVERAQNTRLPIQNLVDQITFWFVPAVLAVALFTFCAWLVWGPTPALATALVYGVAVLIIACPCAMGLAMPTSIMVGMGRAAQLGVMFRRGQALQALRHTRVVAFDKTGTLTQGKPQLTDFESLGVESSGIESSGTESSRVESGLEPGFESRRTASHDTLLGWLAAVQTHSEHPIAHAILEAAQDIPVPAASDFLAIDGAGVQAQVQGHHVVVGSEALMQTHGIGIQAGSEQIQRWADAGKTPVHMAVDGRLAAVFAVSDPVKPSAQSALALLHDMGVRTVMLTGDNLRTAQAVAAQLGIDEVHARLLPADKVTTLQSLHDQGAVAFVGDGINDAPALAAADVGIAIGAGTDIAIEAADVVLMGEDLGAVAQAIALSRATLANIRQNLFWAFAYNVALIPLATGVFQPLWGWHLSPTFAAAAMAVSSVFVVSNALRLKRFRAPHVTPSSVAPVRAPA